MEGQEQNIPKKSRPWDVNGRFETFEEADSRREDLLAADDNRCDIKVRRLCVGEKRWAFFVKTRLKEEFIKKNEKKKVRRENRKSGKQTSQRADDLQA